MFSTTLTLVLCVTWQLTSQVQAGTKDDAYRLHSALFNSSVYNKEVRPSANVSISLFVYLGFRLLSLVSVDEKDQTLSTIAQLDVEWSDYLLSWDPSSYGGIDTVLVKQKNIWLPDIVVSNSVKSQKQLGFDELPARIFSNGIIKWEPSDVISTSCAIDVTYYPFDTQICDIEFQTAMSIFSEVDIDIDRTVPIPLDDYSPDGQWELKDTDAINLSNEGGKSKIRFSVLLKRRRTFFLVNIIFPVLFLSLTASLVFALPADAGEKMGMSITVLLAFAVYLTIVSDVLPQTSVQTSILALYLTILLGVTAFSVLASVFILRLYHRPDSEPVGPKMYKFTVFLRKVFGHHLAGTKTTDCHPRKNTVTPTDNEYSSYPNDVPPAPSAPPPVYEEETLTWQEVSRTLDWFLFVVFTAFSVFLTIFCLAVLAIGAQLDSPSLNKAPVSGI